MPTEVLNQLRTLREGIAEALRKDPRYLTLAALDKSIAEISGVLTASGLLPAGSTPPAPVHFDAVPAHAAAPATDGIAAEAVHAKGRAPAPESTAPAADKDEDSEPTEEDPGEPEATAEGDESEPAEHEATEDEATDDEPADTAVGRHDAAPRAAAAHHETVDEPAGDDPEADGTDASPVAEETPADEPDSVIPKGKASGYKAMAAKPGAPQYQPAIAVKFGKLPNKVDLRPLMTPVEDQGQTSSCVANAVAGAYEYWIKKASKQDHNISRLFVYYNARWRDGSQDKDEGSVIQLAMEGLSKFGACPETVWPFDPHLILKKPGAEAYKDGAPYKVQDMAQVPLKLESWKQALAEGKPIVFGCELFDSFDECTQKGGVVPMPAPDDIARKKHSGHSMCAVGYSDTEKVFIVRNSWGTDFGDKGYCYMPYAYLMSPKFNDGDCWVFVPKVPMQPPRETWIDNTDPVTNDGKGVDFKIETYTIEDYAHVAVDLFQHVRRPFNTFLEGGYSEYIALAEKSLYSQMEHFDFRSFLTATAALAGVAVVAESLYSETTSSETSSTEALSAMAETDADSADEDGAEDDAAEETDDEAEEAGEDEAEDDDGDAEDDDGETEDDDGETEDADGETEDDDGETENDDGEAEDDDGEAEDDDGEAEDDDGEAEDGDDETEDAGGETEDADGEAEDEGDDAEDDAGDDDGGGEDDGGGDEGGDDE